MMVFPAATRAGEKFNSIIVENTIALMHGAGLETYLYWSVQHDEVICKIKCPLHILQKFAQHVHFKLILDEDRLVEAAKLGHPDKNVKPIDINHDPSITPLRPYQFIYARYVCDEQIQSLYACEDPTVPHPFSSLSRLKLIPMLLRFAGIDVPGMIAKHQILAFFPLHSRPHRAQLRSSWLVWRQLPNKQPISEIKNYFGEEVALYFAFIGHYTTWLLPLSVFGLLSFFDQVIEQSPAAIGSFVFCFLVAFWAVLMLKFWERKQAKLAMMWGTTDFETEELIRPSFKGYKHKSVITGKIEMYDSPYSRQKKVMQSQAIIITLIIIIIAAILGVYTLRVYLKRFGQTDFIRKQSSTIASFANAIQIQIFDVIYYKVAIYLTERENHRTDTQFQDSLIGKLFLIKFVNSYSSLYYIAFLQKMVEGACDHNSCMLALGENVAIIFLTNILIGNFTQILLPKINHMIRKWRETRGTWNEERKANLKLSIAERDYIMEPYDHIMGMISDYSSLCVQFGYVTLFVAAFPLAPLFAFISNYAEIRTDGYKLLFTYQRFEPYGAEDIGLWQQIFTYTVVIAVITNAGIVCFTSGVLDTTSTTRIWIFFCIIIIILLFMTFFSSLTNAKNDIVSIQLKRQKYIVKKIVFAHPDHIYETNTSDETTWSNISSSDLLDLSVKSMNETKRYRIDIFDHDE